MNNCSLSGNVVKNPEMRTTQSGFDCCRFTIAVKRPTVAEKTDFIPCIAWGKTAQFVDKHFRAGQRIEVAGELNMNTYTDKNGNQRTFAEVRCHSVGFGGYNKSEVEGAAEPEPEITLPSDDDDVPF